MKIGNETLRLQKRINSFLEQNLQITSIDIFATAPKIRWRHKNKRLVVLFVYSVFLFVFSFSIKGYTDSEWILLLVSSFKENWSIQNSIISVQTCCAPPCGVGIPPSIAGSNFMELGWVVLRSCAYQRLCSPVTCGYCV